jgi:hypothetical protein
MSVYDVGAFTVAESDAVKLAKELEDEAEALEGK